jgi:hypothetical protein
MVVRVESAIEHYQAYVGMVVAVWLAVYDGADWAYDEE